jgi:hypothetical protein
MGDRWNGPTRLTFASSRQMGNIPRNSLLQVVREHLDYIADDWHEDVTDAVIRRGSVALRALIVEGALQRAWKQAGYDREPQVTTTVIPARVFSRSDHVIVANAGGATIRGIRTAGTAIFDYAMTDAEISAIRQGQAAPEEETMGIVRFRDTTCLLTRGVEVSRHHVIKYVANKLGGAHFDDNRAATEEGRIHRALDGVLELPVEYMSKDIINFELLSIGQTLARSNDVMRLRDQLRS